MLRSVLCAFLVLFIREGNGQTCQEKPAFHTNFCTATNEAALGFYVLNAMGGSWPMDQFCQAVSSAPAQAGSYDLSVDLYNYKGSNQVHYGHPGVLFNAKDSMNYDFVYFRPHSASTCYQTGYVSDGVVKLTSSASCPNGPPKGRVWFTVKVVVRGPHTASIYLDGQLVLNHNMHFPALGRGGALAANGYSNLVYFRNYNLHGDIVPQVSGCVPGTGWSDHNTMFLNAAHGTWPASGFCRVLLPLSLSDTVSKYEFTARLYNIEPNVGHPGVMYNVQDLNNFDFVYFRPHSPSGCFQTGYVKNGAPIFAGAISAACPGGGTPSNAWFTVKVKVNGDNAAQIYKDGHLLRTVNPHFSVKARVGIIAANGYRNKVKADAFDLMAI